jgi:hypothetical protein
MFGAPFRGGERWGPAGSRSKGFAGPSCADFPAGHGMHSTPPVRRPTHDTGREPGTARRPSMSRNFISVCPRKCAAFYLNSPALCADARAPATHGHFPRQDPCSHAGSPSVYSSAAAVPHVPGHPYPAWREASMIQFPALAQSGSGAGSLLASNSLPLALICEVTTRRTHQTPSCSPGSSITTKR